jgi:hypothetical protein
MCESFLRIWYFRFLIGFLENLLDRYRSEHHWSVFCHYQGRILLGKLGTGSEDPQQIVMDWDTKKPGMSRIRITTYFVLYCDENHLKIILESFQFFLRKLVLNIKVLILPYVQFFSHKRFSQCSHFSEKVVFFVLIKKIFTATRTGTGYLLHGFLL